MVEKGARSLVYLSRSASSDETKLFLGELESQDCTATVVTGSVSNPEDVARAVRLAPKSVVGVMQMSMVLKVRCCFPIHTSRVRVLHGAGRSRMPRLTR